MVATDFFKLATTLKYLGAKWLPEEKVNFTPCKYTFNWLFPESDRQTPLFSYKAQGSPFRS